MINNFIRELLKAIECKVLYYLYYVINFVLNVVMKLMNTLCMCIFDVLLNVLNHAAHMHTHAPHIHTQHICTQHAHHG